MRELDAFEASGALSTWEQKEAALEAERLSLHAQAFPWTPHPRPATCSSSSRT